MPLSCNNNPKCYIKSKVNATTFHGFVVLHPETNSKFCSLLFVFTPSRENEQGRHTMTAYPTILPHHIYVNKLRSLASITPLGKIRKKSFYKIYTSRLGNEVVLSQLPSTTEA